MSKLTNDGIYYRSNMNVIPFKWSAVEVLKYGKFSKKSDVWSLGVAIWEIFSFGCIPFIGLSNEEASNLVIFGRRLAKPQICPNEIYEILIRTWEEDPEKRPDANELFLSFQEREYELKVKNASVSEISVSNPYIQGNKIQ